MDERQPIRERITRVFDLPGDVVLDVARVILIGSLQMAVENHRGLVEYTPERVTVAVPQGHLRVSGQDLRIGCITPEEIILLGNIAGVELAE